MIKFKKFVFNTFSENTFVVWDEQSGEAMIIDPGCGNKSEEEELSSFISKNNLIIKFMVNTHCHIDHIMGCNFVFDKYKPKYFIPKEDEPLLQNGKTQASLFGIELGALPEPGEYLTENTVLKLGKVQPILFFTPGHSPGAYCFYFEEEKICFTGDVLFEGSIGRTDLWGADSKTLLNSIKTKLYTLPDDVKIYPGHGESSTIGDEKKYNPFIRGQKQY